MLTLLSDLRPPPLFSCKGCGRKDLTFQEMGKDRSKPSGVHSRCLRCKQEARDKQKRTPPPPDPAIALRTQAIKELINRHRQEFEDIIWSVQYRSRPPDRKKQGRKVWVNLGETSL